MRSCQASIEGVTLAPRHLPHKIQDIPPHVPRCPSYVSHILSPIRNNPFCKWLCSSDNSDYDIPRINTKSGELHSVSAAHLTLHETIHAATDPRLLKKNMKTYYFNLCFN